jgi:hypothetical protein
VTGTLNTVLKIALLFVLSMGAFSATQAEDRSTRGIMTWEGEGSIHRISPKELIFQGAFEGVIYFETATGELDGAFATCPASQRINLELGTSSGSGQCEITISTDDVVYAEWDCEGKPGDCKGKFNLVSGLGRFAGITGQSDFRIRSIMGQLIGDAGNGTIQRIGQGIALLPNLKFQVPEQ